MAYVFLSGVGEANDNFRSPCRAFDVELLYIAQQLGMPMKEVAVHWEEIEGRDYSKEAYLLQSCDWVHNL